RSRKQGGAVESGHDDPRAGDPGGGGGVPGAADGGGGQRFQEHRGNKVSTGPGAEDAERPAARSLRGQRGHGAGVDRRGGRRGARRLGDPRHDAPYRRDPDALRDPDAGGSGGEARPQGAESRIAAVVPAIRNSRFAILCYHLIIMNLYLNGEYLPLEQGRV